MEFLTAYWHYVILAIVMVAYGVFAIVYSNNQAKKRDEYFKNNPTVSKVILEQKGDVIHSVAIHLGKIDGEYSGNYFTGNDGNYIVPLFKGTHIIELTYETTRPGVMHKRVTKTYGPYNVEITVEEAQTYTIYFDKKEEIFKIKQ